MARIVVLVAALLVALAGCGADPVPPANAEPTPSGSAGPSVTPTHPEPQILAGKGFRALVSGRTRGERQALIIGRMEIGDGGCLVVADEHGEEHVVVWPAGVTLLTDGRAGVQVPGVGAIIVGESFVGGGGFPYAPLSEPDPPVPSECASDGDEVAVIDRLTGKLLRVADLMARASCQGEAIAGLTYAREAGSCRMTQEVTIAVFTDDQLRDQWVKAQSALGWTFVVGALWAAGAESRLDAVTLAEKLGGQVR